MTRCLPLAGTILLLGLFQATTARAADPDPAAVAAAERLQADTMGAKQDEIVLSLLRAPLVALLSKHGQDQQAAARTYDTLLVPAIRAHLPELRHQTAMLYADKMSVAELDACDAFYRSPTGRKLVMTQAAVLLESTPIITEWARRIAGQAIEENRQALRERGVSL